jgi:hypothetical protein
MFEHVRQRVHELRQAQPGQRFQQYYRQRQVKRSHRVLRLLLMTVGLVCVLIGFLMLVTPGPGVVFLLAGGAFLAEESLWVARAFDGTELRMRAVWQKLRPALKKDRANK